jgi:hypothetical protein
VNRRTKKRESFECLVCAAIVPSSRTGVGMCGDRELERFALRGQSANGSWKKGVPLPAVGPALCAMFRGIRETSHRHTKLCARSRNLAHRQKTRAKIARA